MWALDSSVSHLNHGSFGAVPSAVQAEQTRWLRKIDSNPNAFFNRDIVEDLATARLRAAAFLDADVDGFTFVRNTTTGIASILHSLNLAEGDELIITDHSYGAVKMAASRSCDAAGAVLKEVNIPLRPENHEHVERIILAAVTDRTKAAIVDHLASPTALVFPIERIVAALRHAGVMSIVDAAHSPGAMEVDLHELQPDFWIGNFHKWCCAPRGSAGLYVAEPLREMMRPLIVSWWHADGFIDSFQWWGTDDPSAYLTTSFAIDLMSRFGWDTLRDNNRNLAAAGADLVRGAILAAPFEGSWFECMQVVELPRGVAPDRTAANALAARIADHGVEVAVQSWNGEGLLRVSAQAYNSISDFERLADVLPRILKQAY